MYPERLESKLEHQANHATSLHFDITIKVGIFVYKRDEFPFL